MKIEVDLKGFTPILDTLIERYSLVTASVYGIVWRYAQMEDRVCRASLKKIGKRIKVSGKTVERHIKELCEDGYLEDLTPKLRNKPHIYIITNKAGLTGVISAKNSQDAKADCSSGQTESLSRSDRESYRGQTESPLKKDIKKDSKNISPSAENELSELIQPEDNEIIPPGEVDVILRGAGYDPDEVGVRMKAAADRALAKAKISGPPEVSNVSGNVSVFDYKGNITVKMYDLLYEMAKLCLVTTEIRAEYSEYAHFFWVDSGEPVESIPLEMAKEHGYKPDLTTRYETSGPPENVLVDTQTPYEVDEQTQKDKEETLDEVFGPNPHQQATTIPKPQPNDKPELSEADVAHLQTFGSLPGNETEAFDTIQEIRQAGWEIWPHTVEQGIAHYIEAVRAKRPNFAIPNNPSVRKDWYGTVAGHLQDYQADDLPGLYSAVIEIRDKAGHSFARPGALTKTLPDVVDEPTQKTVVDSDGGFYV